MTTERAGLREWWDTLSPEDQWEAFVIEKNNADALATPDEPVRAAPCDDEQLKAAFMQGAAAACHALIDDLSRQLEAMTAERDAALLAATPDEPVAGLDVERLIRDLCQESGYGQKVADALLRAYAARLREDVP